MPPPPSRSLPWLVAVLAPALVLVAFAGAVEYAADFTMPREIRRLERRLAAAEPVRAVLLGDSVAISALDPALLGAALPEEAGPVVDLMVHGSGPPDWFTLLENRVYRAGRAPRLVVMAGPAGRFLDGEALTDEALWAYASDDEPALAREIFRIRPRDFWWHRRLAARTRLRDLVIQSLPNRLGAFPARAIPGATVADDAQVEGALERVFQQRGRANAAPPQGFELGAHEVDIPLRERGLHRLFDDLAKLGSDAGTQVVVVLTPLLDGVVTERDPDPDALSAAFNDLGIDVIDMSYLPVPRAGFVDGMHFDTSLQPYFSRTAAGPLSRLAGLGPPTRRGRRIVTRERKGADPVPTGLLARDGGR